MMACQVSYLPCCALHITKYIVLLLFRHELVFSLDSRRSRLHTKYRDKIEPVQRRNLLLNALPLLWDSLDTKPPSFPMENDF
jgi:hypothetical protein